jgi:hypothetical protein
METSVGLPVAFPFALPAVAGLPTSVGVPFSLPATAGLPTSVGLPTSLGLPLALPSAVGFPASGFPAGLPTPAGWPAGLPPGLDTCPAGAPFLFSFSFPFGGSCAPTRVASATLHSKTRNILIRFFLLGLLDLFVS